MQAKIHHVTTYNNIVGAVLRGRREEIGLEQADLANRLQLTQSSYSRIENGKTSLTLIQLNNIAPHLRLTPQTFMAQVESVKSNMERQGIEVSPNKSASIGEGITNLLLGAALLTLVTQMIRK